MTDGTLALSPSISSIEKNVRRIVPFLKWAGGKRWLADELANRINCEGRYIEPFLGGGAVFFGVQPERAILGDVNKDLTDTYRAIKGAWRKVLERLEHHQYAHSKEHYYAVRASVPEDRLDRAARFIYLNRTCWNGLYRVNLFGQFNVPIGTKTAVLMDSDDFSSISRLLKGAEILCSDFEALIDRARNGDVIFADPPYTVRHKFNGFIKYNESLFSWHDQVRLRDSLIRARDRGANIFVTNADHSSIRSLYEDHFHIESVERYSAISGRALTRGTYPELLITNVIS